MKKKSAHTSPVLPNFLIAGAAKAGTTALYYYLRQHPDVFMSAVKEPKFFSARAANPGQGPGDLLNARSAVGSVDDYCRLFEKGVGKKAVGEASWETLYHFERSIPAVKRYLGDPRIVIILRDPVKRAYSAYNYLLREGFEELSFKDALIAEEQRRRDGYRGMWQYRGVGLYARQVRAFQEQFGRIQVLLYDDLKLNAKALILSVYTFLDVDPNFVPDISHKHNVSGIPRRPLLNELFVKPKRLHKVVRTLGSAILGDDRWVHLRERVRSVNLQEPPPMGLEIERQLRHFFREDILQLQDYIHRDLSAWLDKESL